MFHQATRSRAAPPSSSAPALGSARAARRAPPGAEGGPAPENSLNDSPHVASLLQMRRALNPSTSARVSSRGSGVIQARATIVARVGVPAMADTIWERLSTFVTAQGLTAISKPDFETALERMHTSPIDYGEINLADDNHVVQLYHNIRRQLPENRDRGTSIDRQERRAAFDHRLESGQHEAFRRGGLNSYMTVFIGSGASVAYAISALGPSFDPRTAAIIGPRTQPWRAKRGPGVIAHPAHQITPRRRYAGATVIDDRWQDRGDFSDHIDSVLHGIHYIPGSVAEIEKYNTFTRITVTGQDRPVYAAKVIIGAGSGDHKVPEGTHPGLVAHDSAQVGAVRRVMSMDVFTEVAGTLWKDHGTLTNSPPGRLAPKSDITVVLSGANGGIDVAYDALRRGYKVEFIVSTGASFLTGFPNYAAYAPYVVGALDALERLRLGLVADHGQDHSEALGKIAAKVAEVRKAATEAGFNPNDRGPIDALYHRQHLSVARDYRRAFEGRFERVYFGRAGAPAATADGIAVNVTDLDGKAVVVRGDIFVYAIGQEADPAVNPVFKMLEPLRARLVPLMDIDRRFSDDGAAVLGLGTTDRMISVVGATAFRYSPNVPPAAAGMGAKAPVVASLPGNVLINDQLTPSRSQVEAQHGFLPLDIGHVANFVTDDRTALAVHISARYPALADHSHGRYVGMLVTEIIANRKRTAIPDLDILDDSRARLLIKINPCPALPVPPNGAAFQAYWSGRLAAANRAVERG